MFDQLKNLKSLAGLMGNAGEIKEKFEQMQAELARIEIEADAGAGAVRVTVNGKMQILQVNLDPAMITALAGEGADADKVMIEELIVAATNAAMEKAQLAVKDQMAELTGGMNLPGLDGLLG
ncbi:YbaB/EbfC family nucleoid-associated protein [Poriferisphaera sp. WC338]|uniref:YbaB/EbfC family nucleoid-associated protein n=1 Tax=Poriferisphaera sp. WC338 TaxID=3425129 RepID=UPI003D813CD6